LENDTPFILVVDDDSDTRLLIERKLSATYRVVTAESGPRALELAAQSRPALVLSDIGMPGMDGYQFCAALHELLRPASVPVIFLTASSAEQDKRRAFAVGGADYLTKPTNPRVLLAMVQKHLETRRRWQARRPATVWDEATNPARFAEFLNELTRDFRPRGPAMVDLSGIQPQDVYACLERIQITEHEMARRLAAFFQTECLDRVEPESIQLGVLPPGICRSKGVAALRIPTGEELFVILNPFVWGLQELDVLNNACQGARRRIVLSYPSALAHLFSDTITGSWQAPTRARVILDCEEMSATDTIDSLIAEAVRRGASDLHIQPSKFGVDVRCRVDGHLQPMFTLNAAQLPSVVARVKVMSGMNISETRKPQDGQCVSMVDGREIELRVSSLPATHGEKLVLRILAQSTALRDLESLGFEPEMLESLRRLLVARQGMILITGPTGSGKTTVLYAALSHLNLPETNILTVEDPVEMDLPGVTQVQVHDRAGRSFPMTLRAMLRQDPDVIMVGEVRDLETAEIACRAALTGHLVLSTLHTQDTVGTLLRLFEMGVPAYLAAASVNAVLAQRLAQRVCTSCACDCEPSPALLAALEARFGKQPGARFRRGAGCHQCQHTGRRGRIAVFELLVMDDDLRAMMVNGAAPSVVRQHLEAQKFRTLEEDAYLKACRGEIPPEEIVKLGLGFAVQMTHGEAPPSAGTP